jgi:hypothetical protein
MSVVVAYRAATAAEAELQYHADALHRAAGGWVPTYEHRRNTEGEVALAVTYEPDAAAAAEVFAVLQAMLAPLAQPGVSRPRRWLRARLTPAPPRGRPRG